MAPADGEDEKYYFRESIFALEKAKEKEKDTIILL